MMTPPAPRVTVVIPAYNAFTTVAQAVRSALAQTMADLEVIVSDDGSRPPIADALREIDDERLRVIRLPANRGVSAARNAAVAEARAPLVAQLDADDLWYPAHLEAMLPAFADADVGLAYGNADVRGHPDGRHRWIVGSNGHPVNDLARLYAGNPAPSPTVVMRTEAVRAVGGYPTWLSVGEDYLLYIRLRRAGWRLAYVAEPTAVYRWPEPGRGATFNRRRNARQGAKMFAVLWLGAPRDRALGRRLANEMIGVLATHVPGSLQAGRALRRTGQRLRRAGRRLREIFPGSQ
ncbi:MAG: glycosyltransferase family 2 protein [Solirubrobacteraceae bacterium]